MLNKIQQTESKLLSAHKRTVAIPTLRDVLVEGNDPPRPKLQQDGKIQQKKVLSMLRLSSPNMSNFDIDVKDKDASEGSHSSVVIANKMVSSLNSTKCKRKNHIVNRSLCEMIALPSGDDIHEFGANQSEVKHLKPF